MKRSKIGPFRRGLRRWKFYSDALKNAFNATTLPAAVAGDGGGGGLTCDV